MTCYCIWMCIWLCVYCINLLCLINGVVFSLYWFNTAWNVSKYGVFSNPYFSAFGLNTERYSVSLRIQSERGKIRTRKTFVFGHFSHSVTINPSLGYHDGFSIVSWVFTVPLDSMWYRWSVHVASTSTKTNHTHKGLGDNFLFLS